MILPLGGLRRERKRLKRCAHRQARSMRDQETDSVTTWCIPCGAQRTIFREWLMDDERRLALTPTDLLPSRIARRAADA